MIENNMQPAEIRWILKSDTDLRSLTAFLKGFESLDSLSLNYRQQAIVARLEVGLYGLGIVHAPVAFMNGAQFRSDGSTHPVGKRSRCSDLAGYK